MESKEVVLLVCNLVASVMMIIVVGGIFVRKLSLRKHLNLILVLSIVLLVRLLFVPEASRIYNIIFFFCEVPLFFNFNSIKRDKEKPPSPWDNW